MLYLSELNEYWGRLGGSRAGASVIVARMRGGGSDGVWTSKVGARVVAVDDSGGIDLCRILSSVSGDADISSIMLCLLVIWYEYNVLI